MGKDVEILLVDDDAPGGLQEGNREGDDVDAGMDDLPGRQSQRQWCPLCIEERGVYDEVSGGHLETEGRNCGTNVKFSLVLIKEATNLASGRPENVR